MTREAPLKSTTNTRKKELKVEGTPDNDLDVIEENFIQKIKRGTKKTKR